MRLSLGLRLFERNGNPLMSGFCVKDLVFSAGHYSYVEFTEPPVLGAAGTNGTLTVNGSSISHDWTQDSIEGNRLYLTATPSFVSGDVILYTYDPITDGGVTNAKGDQLCAQTDSPFREIMGLFKAAINSLGGVLFRQLVGAGIPATSVHSDVRLALDHEGVYQEYPVNEPVWSGGRFVKTFFTSGDDFSNAVDAGTGTGVAVITSGFTGAGLPGSRVQLTLNGGVTVNDEARAQQGVTAGGFTGSVYLTNQEATAVTLTFRVNNNKQIVSLAPNQVVRVSKSAGFTGHLSVSLFGDTDSQSIDVIVSGCMVEDSGSITDLCSEFVNADTGIKVFSTVNGNTVDVNGVVTEAQGADIATDIWQQVDEAGTNLVLWSNMFDDAAWVKEGAPSITGDILTLAASVSTIHQGFTASADSNTISLEVKLADSSPASAIRLTTNNSAAWSTGVSVKQALTSEWTPIILTDDLTAYGTGFRAIIGNVDEGRVVDPDCVGDVRIRHAQIETGIYRTLYIPTTTAAASILPIPYVYNQDNFDVNNSASYIKLDAGTVDKTLIQIGGVDLLSYIAGELSLDTGAGLVTYPIGTGSHEIGIALGDASIQLTIDGNIQTAVPYTPYTPGSITATPLKFWDFRSEVVNTFAEAQAKVIEITPV